MGERIVEVQEQWARNEVARKRLTRTRLRGI